MIHAKGRRNFVRRVTTLATGAGAMLLGLVPEARSQASTVTGIAAVATPAPPDPGVAPPSGPLSVERQNLLYSAALNDATVALLLSGANVQGRIDPPIEHCEVILAGGSRPQTVVMPVMSYTTGQRIAVVAYGVDAGVSQGAGTATMRAVVLGTGDVKIAAGDQVFDSPRPEWKDVYQARYFPERYFASVTTAALGPTMDRSRLLVRWRLAFSAALMKTRNADDDGTVLVPDPRLQDCYDQCRVTAQGAAATIMLTIGAAALAMSFWCLACILIALAGATVTGPLVISLVAGKCAYACMWAAGALAGLALALANAVTQRRICEKNCALQFPPIPKPPPRPPGPIAAGGALGVHG